MCIGLGRVYSQSSADNTVHINIDSVLEQMTLEEKVLQLSGRSFDTEENTRLNIPGFHMVDGPLGIGQPHKNGVSTAFPSSVALAATWDVDLALQMGKAIGLEAGQKGKNVLLAPCMNIQRFYGGGRNFESFSEDPLLSSRMSVGFINGAQSTGVIACAKHFVCNNQERNRINLNVKVSERALREIYFPSFKAAVQEAGVLAVMTSYNKVNGHYSGENKWLINDVLKQEWGFKGLAISDWESIYSAKKAYKAGLDMDMPWARHFGDSLLQMIKNNELPLETLDEKVKRILHVKNQLQQTTIKNENTLGYGDDLSKHEILSKNIATSSVVLLKNKDKLLPLDLEKLEQVAVIGPNASIARMPKRGSANVEPPYSVSPLDGLYSLINDSSKILYVQGCDLIEKPYTSENVKITHGTGNDFYAASFYANQHLEGAPILETEHQAIDFDWGNDSPLEALDKDNFSVKWTGNIQVPSTGWYSIDVSCYGGYKLEFNNKCLIDQWFVWKPKGIESIPVYLDSEETYPITLKYFESEWEAGAQLGIRCLTNPKLLDVKNQVSKSDVAIVFLGFSDVYEQEGNDRTSFSLPKEQLDLLEATIETGKKVIVVLNAGTAIEMDSWLEKVDAVLFAWYGGMESGTAIAEILTGKQNPSGRLPFTYPRMAADYSVNTSYFQNDTLMIYDEGIYVGYRYYEKHHIEPLFDFGFGLSYTEFEYSNLSIEAEGDSIFLKLEVKNVGNYDGAEVVQIYVGKQNSEIDRPAYELKGFKKVFVGKGQVQEISIGISKKQLRYYDTEISSWAFENGVYNFQIGQSKNKVLTSGSLTVNY